MALLRFLTLAAIVFVMSSAWALATPLGAGPDEPSHIATAYEVARGQLGVSHAYVPAYIADLNDASGAPCFAFKPDKTAECETPLATDPRPTRTMFTQFGPYLPPYFLAVGLPTLVLSGAKAIYAMRLINAAIFAALMGAALAVVLPLSKRRIVFAGVLCSVVPMSAFLGGAVSSSAFEIGAATLLWAVALRTFSAEHRDDRPMPRRWIAALVFASVLLLCTRLLAPLWITIIFVAAITLSQSWRRLGLVLRRREGMVGAAIIVVAFALTLVWNIAHPSRYLGITGPPTSLGSAWQIFVTTLINHAPVLTTQAAGTLGWLDTALPWAPFLVYTAWAILTGMALVRAPHRRDVIALLTIGVLGVMIPVTLESLAWSGIGWQGRYSLPLLVGIPICAAFVLSRNQQSNSTAAANRPNNRDSMGACAALALIAVASIYAFAISYHRYAVGADRPYFVIGTWESPGGFWPPFGALVAAWALVMVMTIRGTTPRRRPSRA